MMSKTKLFINQFVQNKDQWQKLKTKISEIKQ